MSGTITEAREHHRKAQMHMRRRAQRIDQRDEIVRELYAGGGWSYATLAKEIGCTPEVIAKIINPQR